MSLRIRLNLLITLLFISLFICSSFYIITNARNAVQHEVESTANLALQLIQVAFTSASLEMDEQKQIQVLRKLSELDLTRHLHIDIYTSNDVLTPVEEFAALRDIKAPNWFVKLVEPPPTEIRHWLYNPVEPPKGIIIRADPSDEIDENWTEVRSILIFLLAFIILANILLYLAIGKYLAPIDTILSGLSDIEKGNYQLELPRFRLPELDRISQQFNHMAKVLLESKAKNQSLTQRSLEIQEEERRHLAQELHDELGQTIAAIKAVAAAIMNDKSPDKDRINSSVKTIIEYSDHIYQVAKNMMHRLRPSVLDEFGLVKALQSMIDDWNSRQDDIFCHFSFSDVPTDLTELLNISLFRIVQESLTNALKHSSASKIIITMNKVVSSGSEYISLNIQDDGVGLNKEKLMTGLGLPGMKERVEMNHGTFELISEPNNGLTINISIPIKS
ncbi:MAG: two-component system sensor histidine kinase UhpB [Gammaproteobacteria bacterium]|jgi:two-component system sensor histidine kinase UhpB